MVWWDNRQSMHRASPYDENMGPRDVRRATVKDDGPDAFGVTKPVAVSTVAGDIFKAETGADSRVLAASLNRQTVLHERVL